MTKSPTRPGQKHRVGGRIVHTGEESRSDALAAAQAPAAGDAAAGAPAGAAPAPEEGARQSSSAPPSGDTRADSSTLQGEAPPAAEAAAPVQAADADAQPSGSAPPSVETRADASASSSDSEAAATGDAPSAPAAAPTRATETAPRSPTRGPALGSLMNMPEASADEMAAAAVAHGAAAAEASPPSPGPAPASPARSGFGPLFAAALLGGAISAGILAAYDAFLRDAGTVSPTAPAGVSGAIGAVETRLQSVAGRADDAFARARDAQAKAAEALERQAVGTASARDAAAAVTALRDRIGAVEGRAGEVGQRVDALAGEVRGQAQGLQRQGEALQQRLTQQDERIAALADRSAVVAANLRAGAIQAIAARDVLDALGAGIPYAQPLAVLKRLGADPARLAALEPFAATGAPGGRALAERFGGYAERIDAAVSAQSDETAAGGFLRRFAERAVTVSPAGTQPPAPGDPESRVARHLAAGDLGQALAAWEAMPEAARAASSEFATLLKQRLAADEAARALAADSFAALEASAR